MSHANDFDIFGASKTVLSYYIAILQQNYFARGSYRWSICQTIGINFKNLVSAGCFVTREVTRAMSHANTGHSKEMVPNYFILYTHQNLKIRPSLELLRQIKDFTTFSNHLKPLKGLKSRNIRKVSMWQKHKSWCFLHCHPKLRWPSNTFNRNDEKPLSNS